MSPIEEYENFFYYFAEAVEMLTKSPDVQCQELGHFNVAWELQHDLLENYAGIKSLAPDRLGDSALGSVRELVSLLEHLPSEAIESDAAAVYHPSWNQVRESARSVMGALTDAITVNRSYFAKE